MNTDYLIVGQGIAGTLLSYELKKFGSRFLIIDNGHKTAASSVAAGVINPITGRRYVKSWMIDDLLKILVPMYQELEQMLQSQFFYKQNIIRVIYDEAGLAAWEKLLVNDSAEKYVSSSPSLGLYEHMIYPVYGFGELQHSYRVDLPKLISVYKEYLKKNDWLISENFDIDQLEISEERIVYKGIKAKSLIFANGYKAATEGLFTHLPFQPAKGEALTFTLDNQLRPEKMLRHKHFIVPLADQSYWSGGGYFWSNPDETPTSEFLDNWKLDMESILKTPYQIIEHKAGVRPSVKGRRPLIGQHPKFKNVYLFNGLGTKGASLAPYWSRHFADHLTNNHKLSEDVDVKRFVK